MKYMPSGSERKTITINPDFFKMSKKSKSKSKNIDQVEKKMKRKKKKSLASILKPNQVKKQLIERIKNHQREINEKKNKNKMNGDNFEDDFSNSLSYLEQIKQKRKNKTLKRKKKMKQPINVRNSENVQIVPSSTTNTHTTIEQGDNFGSETRREPLYGILKGGKKQLYSQWKKTLKNKKKHKQHFSDVQINTKPFGEKEETPNPSISFNLMNGLKSINNSISNALGNNTDSKSVTETQTEIKNTDNKNKLTPEQIAEKKAKMNKLMKKFKKKTKTIKRTKRKYKLGNHRKTNKISVLIKDKKTRKKISEEYQVLTKKPLSEIRHYLKERNLIKSGSVVPEDILRNLYEESYLAGDIHNKNVDNMLHNFINE